MDKLLTIDELAQAFRVSTRTIYRMRATGSCRSPSKIKGSWRFRESAVAAWLEKNQVGKTVVLALPPYRMQVSP